MKSLHRVTFLLGLLALGATSVDAAMTDFPADEGIRVVNNYGELVRVYAEDAEGRLHALGRVAPGNLAEFDIPEEISREAFRIKVYPAQSAGGFKAADFGVKTNPLHLQRDSQVTLWVEPDLTRSVVELARG